MSNFQRRSKKCQFTANGEMDIDYKDVETLKKYIGETGKIIPSRITGTKAWFQRRLARAIKRARYVSLIPYCDRHHQ